VRIANGTEEIGASAFINCSSLESIYIPASVKVIKANAFSGCRSLKEIHYGGSAIARMFLKVEAEGNEAFKKAKMHYNSN
jgi:hypothetical protein